MEMLMWNSLLKTLEDWQESCVSWNGGDNANLLQILAQSSSSSGELRWAEVNCLESLIKSYNYTNK